MGTDTERMTHEFCQTNCDLFVGWGNGCSYGTPPRQTSAATHAVAEPTPASPATETKADDTVGKASQLSSWFRTLHLSEQREVDEGGKASTTKQTVTTRTSDSATSESNFWSHWLTGSQDLW